MRLVGNQGPTLHIIKSEHDHLFGGCAFEKYPTKGNKQDMLLKTLFMQEMLKKNILIPWISICYRHGNKELDMIANALVDVFKTIKKTKNIKKKVEGHILKPVFRKYN